MSEEKFYEEIRGLVQRYHPELAHITIHEDDDLSTLIDSFIFARILMHIEELRETLIHFDTHDWQSAYSLKKLYTLFIRGE